LGFPRPAPEAGSENTDSRRHVPIRRTSRACACDKELARPLHHADATRMELLGSPAMFISSAFIGLVGTALFLYGKKQPDLRCLFTGVGMCVYPFFIHSVILLWVVFAAMVAGLYALIRHQ
jgi:hypothetical protein